MRAALCAASVRACLRRACSRRACVVQDAAAAAEDMLRRKDKLGKRRMRTFKLVDDDIELDDAEENIEDVVQDEMLAPVFFDEQLRDDAGGGLRSHHLKFAIASAEMGGEEGAGGAAGRAGAGAGAGDAGPSGAALTVKYALASTEHVKSVSTSSFAAARVAIAREEGHKPDEVALFSAEGMELRAQEDDGTDLAAFLAQAHDLQAASENPQGKERVSLFVVVGVKTTEGKNARQPLGFDASWQPAAVEQTSKAMAAFLSTLHVVSKHAKKKVPVPSFPVSCPSLCACADWGLNAVGSELARGVGQLHAVSARVCGLICAVQGGEACTCAEAGDLWLSLSLSANSDSAAPSAKRDFGESTRAREKESSELIGKECVRDRQSARERGYRRNAGCRPCICSTSPFARG